MPYLNSKHTAVSKPIGVNNQPDGARTYFYDADKFIYRPYISVTEALSYLATPANRKGHFPIVINSTGVLETNGTITGGSAVEYWFKDGIADSNLIIKQSETSGFATETFVTNITNPLGQTVIDNSSDITNLKNRYSVPTGGNQGQVLTKQSNNNGDTIWSSVSLGTDETFLSDVTIGGVTQGDTLTVGTISSITTTLKKILQKTFYPTFIAPTFSISQNAGILREIGESVTVGITLNFNRGSISGKKVDGVWQPSTVQDFRAGTVDGSGYKFIGAAIDGSDINQSTPTYNKTHTVTKGINTFNGTITYLSGPQPIDSTGANFGPVFPAGTSSNLSTSLEGIFPIFATTLTITSGAKQAPVSMLTANNIQINLVAETGGSKQFIDIPTDWLSSRPLVAINNFNVISNSFDSTNKLTDYTITDTTNIVQGVSRPYKRVQYNGSNRGSQLIRLVF